MGETKKVKAGGNLFKILIVVILLVILAGGAGFAGYMISTKTLSNAGSTGEGVSTTEHITEAYHVTSEESLLINLADESGKRYLRVKVVIGYDSENSKLTTELEEKTNVLVDALISVIRTKKVENLTAKGSDDLKKELVERINTLLSEGKITNVYYEDFLIQ